MTPLLAALGVWLATGTMALLLPVRHRGASWLAASGTIAGSVLAGAAAVRVLAGGPAPVFSRPWSIPHGELALRLDPLSAWFVLVIVLVSPLAALYGVSSLRAAGSARSTRPCWFFFQVLVASMVTVVTASNALLFLVAWEAMAVASFFLVTFEDDKEPVREAGWVYLVAAHLGTAFLIVFFLIMARETGTTDFARWTGDGLASAPLAGMLFVLALAGFGSKAGFIPLHVWLPKAHPAAPSHVSALMSGVMIKTGVYGLARAITFLGAPPLWWGWTLVGVGLASGILGVVFALAQRDLKRLLAYSSVENVGIIALGLGIGLIGASLDLPLLVVLGHGGALLHVLNHALFKSLLFLGAGSVAHAAGTRDIERLGGLLKRMPWTGATFAAGSAAICALPPFNGFAGELLILLGAFHAGQGPKGAAFAGWLVIGGMGLIGGLAAACFTRAFGIVFLGEPRGGPAIAPRESGALMRWPMAVLAAACVGLGPGAALALRAAAPAIGTLAGPAEADMTGALASTGEWLRAVALAASILIALALALAWLRRGLLAGRPVRAAATWDCGYARPTARMQYTGSSFAQPLTSLFAGALGTVAHQEEPAGLFPSRAHFASKAPDVFEERLYAPVFRGVKAGLGRLRWLQHGAVQLYIFYIAMALLALLVWKVR